MGGVVGINRWTPEIAVKYLPQAIRQFYTDEAKQLIAELDSYHLNVFKIFEMSPSGNRVDSARRVVDQRNPSWYRQLCAAHAKAPTKRFPKEGRSDFSRESSYSALERIASEQDKEMTDHGAYRYDEVYRKLIHIRMLCGSYTEEESKEDGYNLPNSIVRNFFGNPAIIKPHYFSQSDKYVDPIDLDSILQAIGVPTKSKYFDNVYEFNRNFAAKLAITKPLFSQDTTSELFANNKTGTYDGPSDEIPF